MKYIIKEDGYQPSMTFGPFNTMEEAITEFWNMITAFEEGLDDIDELAIDEQHTSYFAEWEDGEWYSLEIVEEEE